MTSRSLLRSIARSLAASALAGLCLLALACDEDHEISGEQGGGMAALVIGCEVASGSVPAGSAAGVVVGAVVTQNGLPVPNQTVVFTSSIGDVTPDAVTTGADGRAAATFLPPGVAGTALVTTTAVGPAGNAAATCPIQVTGSARPVLTVSVLAPAQLAGLRVTVRYPAARLSVAPGGLEALGNLTSAAAGCVNQANDDGIGTATLVMACTMLQNVAGTQVARLTFDSVGASPTLGDFLITCVGSDVNGVQSAATCQGSLTLL